MPATSAPEPLVTIVTACLNSGRFVEQTILSVLEQGYPRLEYIVMDGGSTDGTIEILKKYEARLRWRSSPDKGAADAINKGFALGSGAILGFLNADDLYLPGAVSAAVRHLREAEDAGVYGDAWWIDEAGGRIAPYPVKEFDRAALNRGCFICQPASLFRRSAFESVGGLDPDLHLAFDYDFWLRLTRTHRLRRIPEALAESRMHRANKTLGQREAAFRETFRVLKRNCGYVPFPWVYSYLCYRADARDQFFEPLQPSILRYVESLPAGLWLNPGAMGEYAREWASIMSWSALRRRLAAFQIGKIPG
ncbi:MAG TPA: glycosyltransferase family 2 protein [Bryobacteraceae bacterium]|nr:glycosyltransferase family 2 protein [Bryobacteraceae bacterium]